MRSIIIENNTCIVSLTNEEVSILYSEKEISQFNLLSVLIFQNLLDNGQAELLNNTIVFSLNVLYNVLTKNDIIGLNLPKISAHKLVISANHLLSNNEFQFSYSFYDHYPHGTKLKSYSENKIMFINGQQFLLPYKIFKSLDLIEEHNKLPIENKILETNLTYLANIKKLLNDTDNVFFDSYLDNEDVIIPQKISLHIESSDQRYALQPCIASQIDESFQKNFNIYPSVKNTYSTQEKGTSKRKRIILEEDQIEQLKKIKALNKLKDNAELIRQIAEKPADFLDPEVIDISEFYSERVIDIGIYQPKFSKFITPYKSDWLPGITIDLRNNGSDQIIIHDQEELDELNTIIIKAEEHNSKSIDFKEHSIPVPIAKELQKLAIRQFDSKGPIEDLDGEKIQQKKVLIILDNTEELEYNPLDNILEKNEDHKSEVKHRFYSIRNLQKGIQLKSHQEEGIAWLQNLYKENYDGCLLADDMGLGKTLQVLYFLEWLGCLNERDRNDKPILIVAPISLLENWQMEYAKFFINYSYDIVPLFGPQAYQKNAIDPNMISFLNKKQIILTNYETLRIYQLSMCAINFRVVILDEAQKIKTPGTLITTSVKALKSDFKIAMTGTPVENSLLDLWCITDFVCPGLLSSAKVFSKKYQNPLKKENVDMVQLGEDLRKEIGCFFKRRLKKDVAKDLPDKIKSTDPEKAEYFRKFNLERQMPAIQLQYYKEIINIYSNHRDDSDMLRYIGLIKEISDHPFLNEDNFLERDSLELINTSAKLQTTIDILDAIALKSEKVILFAERRDTQKMLQKIISYKYNIVAPIINGDTPTITPVTSRQCNLSRQETINRFSQQNGFSVIILSPIAAGVGLNIVSANHVIHYSRHWNPAKEEQATDRAYRIGQKKDVFVYYPMAISDEFKSFDLILNDLLERKLLLASHTLFPTNQAEVTFKEFSSIFN